MDGATQMAIMFHLQRARRMREQLQESPKPVTRILSRVLCALGTVINVLALQESKINPSGVDPLSAEGVKGLAHLLSRLRTLSEMELNSTTHQLMELEKNIARDLEVLTGTSGQHSPARPSSAGSLGQQHASGAEGSDNAGDKLEPEQPAVVEATAEKELPMSAADMVAGQRSNKARARGFLIPRAVKVVTAPDTPIRRQRKRSKSPETYTTGTLLPLTSENLALLPVATPIRPMPSLPLQERPTGVGKRFKSTFTPTAQD